MIPMTLAELADLVHGSVTVDVADLVVSGPPYLDSREPVPDGLFVAIVGERTDGHRHAAGAHAVLGSRPTDAPTVVVDDPEEALGRLARHVLDRLPGVTVHALTGSQGKTGTKDYLAHLLAGSGPTVATRGNQNNELGVPLTVLRADTDTRHLVVEMGARHVGNIRYLCEIAPPRIAAVLNVGTAHVGEFGSREAIARAKGEIVEALPDDGTAVLAADDPVVAGMADRTAARALTFGRDGDVAWRAVTADDLGRAGFELGYAGAWAPVRLRQLGAHQVANAVAAGAMALAAGLELDAVAAGLSEAAASSRWRMEPHERSDGALVVNDAYNANPDSMAAALDWLGRAGRRSGRRTVAVLGGMLELGDDERQEHRRVGHLAAAAGIDVVVTVGRQAAEIADCAATQPAYAGEVTVTAGRDEALAWLRDNVRAHDVVLVKASRGFALERLVDGLLETPPPSAAEGEPR